MKYPANIYYSTAGAARRLLKLRKLLEQEDTGTTQVLDTEGEEGGVKEAKRKKHSRSTCNND